ncbi:MAG: hypothetical protein JXA92_05325 [candidate division Zixibacteria bacterium]|nr:hypothetical protein [candidate division Zixibacteria bacterium]
MRKTPLFSIITAVSLILINTGVCADAPDVSITVDSFFKAVQQGDLTNAYDNYLSEEFRAVATGEEFRAFLEQYQLVNYKKAAWDSVAVSQVSLEGEIITANDSSVPLNITLVLENGNWKIQSIYRVAGTEADEGQRTFPSDNELRAMADTATQRLGRAINTRDFTEFYDRLSDLFKSQTTPEALYSAFKSFADQDIDLTAVKGLKPVFNLPPNINDDGILVLKGNYPSKPLIVYFEIKYIYEHPDWKLFGINVSVR